MRKLAFCICENKGADQFSLYRYPSKSESSNLKPIFCGCTSLFVSDLVGNLDDRFSCDEAHNVLGANLGLFLNGDVPVMEDLGAAEEIRCVFDDN